MSRLSMKWRGLLPLLVAGVIFALPSAPGRECGLAHAAEQVQASATLNPPVAVTPLRTETTIMQGAGKSAQGVGSTAPIIAGASASGTGTAALGTVPRPRMVDLGAGTCIPCKKMIPVLEEAKKVFAGVADIEFIDVWENKSAGEPYGIRTIPTQIFFDREGKEVWRHEGFLPLEEIAKQFETLGAKPAGK